MQVGTDFETVSSPQHERGHGDPTDLRSICSIHHDEMIYQFFRDLFPRNSANNFSAELFACSDTSYFVEQAQFTDRHSVS